MNACDVGAVAQEVLPMSLERELPESVCVLDSSPIIGCCVCLLLAAR